MNNLINELLILFCVFVGFIAFLGWINRKRQKELRKKLRFKVMF